MAKSKSNPFLGRWRIESMDGWDQDFVDEDVEGFIAFEKGLSGEFQFGYVIGFMDCQLTSRDGNLAIEWSWDGNDEMDPTSGRGWATFDPASPESKDLIRGEIFIHNGDHSGFVARRKAATRKPRSKNT